MRAKYKKVWYDGTVSGRVNEDTWKIQCDGFANTVAVLARDIEGLPPPPAPRVDNVELVSAGSAVRAKYKKVW